MLGPAADRVTVILPWGDLLRAIASMPGEGPRALAALCQPGGHLESVFSLDPERDAGLPGLVLDASYVHGQLQTAYESSGFRVTSLEPIGPGILASYETTWAKRLAFGRHRAVWRLRAVAARTEGGAPLSQVPVRK